MSTNRIPVMQPRAAQTVPGSELSDGGENFPLQAAAPLEIRLCGAQSRQELADQSADRSVVLGRPDAGPPVDVVRQ